MESGRESPTARKFLRLIRVLLADISKHYANGSDEDVRISVVELAWVADLLLKSSVMKRDGDLLDKKRPKFYKSTPDLVNHLAEDLQFDPFDALRPSTRTSLFTLIQAREDAWHRGCQFDPHELRVALRGSLPFFQALCGDARIDFADTVGKDFLADVSRATHDPNRIVLLLKRADEVNSRGATASTFSAALSALEQASFDVDSLPKDVQGRFPTVAYPPSFLVFASPSPEQMEDFYGATKSFFGTLDSP